MELGTGIFLSALVISTIALYGITKDRWNWRRFAKRTAFVCSGLILFWILLVLAPWNANVVMPTPLGRQTQYAGIRLGMSQDEVLYIKGVPSSVLTEEISDPQWKGYFLVVEPNKLEKGKSVRDYRNWSYKENFRDIQVAFNDLRTSVTAITCVSHDKLYRCPAIAGVEDGDAETKVSQVLGNNPQSQLDDTVKSLTYPDLGVKIYLTKEEVYKLRVSAPGYVPH